MPDHSITPPPELVQQWVDTYFGGRISHVDLAAQVAQWGADQELEACCEWLDREGWSGEARQLRAARRPKPPSLKEQALKTLNQIPDIQILEYDTIRRALEALPND